MDIYIKIQKSDIAEFISLNSAIPKRGGGETPCLKKKIQEFFIILTFYIDFCTFSKHFIIKNPLFSKPNISGQNNDKHTLTQNPFKSH